MRVYFVRHGETIANRDEIHQTPQDPLSERGEKQAHYLGQRLANIPFTKGLCSSAYRAKQTAEIITRYHPVPFEYTEDLVEWGWPSSIHGTKYDDPKAYQLKRSIDQARLRDSSFVHEDEESFTQIKDRLKKVKDRLERCAVTDQVLVVSHGVTIKSMLGYFWYEETFDMEKFLKLKYFFEASNTGITIFELNHEKWQLMTWNDHAHL